MLRWVYTDELEWREDDAFLTELMRLANRFQLRLLRERQVSSRAAGLREDGAAAAAGNGFGGRGRRRHPPRAVRFVSYTVPELGGVLFSFTGFF